MSLTTLEETLRRNSAIELSDDCKRLIAKVVTMFGDELNEIIEGSSANKVIYPAAQLEMILSWYKGNTISRDRDQWKEQAVSRRYRDKRDALLALEIKKDPASL